MNTITIQLTDEEANALGQLSNDTDLPQDRVMIQALRLYQLKRADVDDPGKARCKSCGNYLHTGYSGIGPPPEQPLTFEQGILWACARLCDVFDQPTMAEELIRESRAKIENADAIDREALCAKGIGRRIPVRSNVTTDD